MKQNLSISVRLQVEGTSAHLSKEAVFGEFKNFALILNFLF